MSRERLGNALLERDDDHGKRDDDHGTGRGSAETSADVSPAGGPTPADADPDAEARAFVRFCYRRRAVAWPDLYDEMCAVAARGEYHGMDYEQLRNVGIGFTLTALPRMAELAAHVIAEERSPQPLRASA